MQNLGNSEDTASGSERGWGLGSVKKKKREKEGWERKNDRKGVQDAIGRDTYKQ